ncbi:hypothetical protein Ahy_A05g023518 [Arachis hypogaea]|uniref:Retrotransposon gag domain-containing protein n=1 Tax=Arachis hypogaea TaxID=3818 RepID=A0A445D3Q0_ARAHY|nr:hypothetical protein Ahy_A05g023518 [Arachis hypogaea]
MILNYNKILIKLLNKITLWDKSELRINLSVLFSIKCNVGESIDKYLARFKNMKNRCFTSVSESEVVKMVVNGLEFGVKKKLEDQQYHDMTQLVENIRQIKQLKVEKETKYKEVIKKNK